jgi:hypothetical protein
MPQKSVVPALTFLLLLAHSTVPVLAQLCDENSLANKGVKIALEASTTCLKGRTPDMAEIGTCQDDSAHDIRLPFAFKFLGRTYNGTGNGRIFVNSNSYVTFGGSSSAGSGLGPLMPTIPTIFIGARDNAMRNLSVGPDALGWRLRYEGWSLPSLVNTHNCSLTFPTTIVWELLFRYDGTLQLCTGVVIRNVTGVSALSDGVSSVFIQKFTLTPSTSYVIHTGLQPCTCDHNLQVKNGVKITTQSSNSCMKGRTPDMIDIRSCKRSGSTSILLPFPFKFLGRTYGAQNDNVFVGDSSFVTFGGPDETYYSSFEPGFSDLPALLVGARQNVLKTLSVAPDPLGWRVRYEGWSDHGASQGLLPLLSSAFTCSQSHVPANITWELLFLYDGTLQLCTGSLMSNLDPIFDSVSINTRACSKNLCSNLFQNLSAVSALSDGDPNSFLQTFTLLPSTLVTISTGLSQCPTSCNNDPETSNRVKVQDHGLSACLKGRTSDMTDVGRCQDSRSYGVRLPFPTRFLGHSYSGDDVFVGSDSFVSFGGESTSRPPPFPSLLIGVRDNAMRQISVGPDPSGWRVRFEGWDTFLTQNQTIECKRPANIIWELLFFYNSTIQLCTGSSMDNLDSALDPPVLTSVWDGMSVVSKFSLSTFRMHTFSFDLPPCSLHLSLSCPIASVFGSSMTALFPPQFGMLPYDSVTLVITLQGVGFSSAPDSPVSLVVSPASSRPFGSASISNSGSAMPLLIVSLSGVQNCSLVSLTLPSVSNPILPQISRKDIRFSMLGPNRNIFFKGDSGTLVEILPPMSIDAGQPTLRMSSNAIRATTTLNITLIPNVMNIRAEFLPSVLVITMAGAGWSLPETMQGKFVRPLAGKITSTVLSTEGLSDHVLRLSFSGVGPIAPKSSLELLLFDVTTVGVTQPASFSIRSAILNSFGSIIASGSNGSLDNIVASTMGFSSPTVTVFPPLVSASAVDIDVSFTPSQQLQRNIILPAHIIITLSGSGFTCDRNAAVKFILPFDAVNSTLNDLRVTGQSIFKITVTSGTFISGYPVFFQFGPCFAPTRVQSQKTDVAASFIDKDGETVAASASGTLSAIVEDIGYANVTLTDDSLMVTFLPQVSVPSNSYLVISLAGVGLVCKDHATIQFLQPHRGASGTMAVEGRPSESIISISFTSEHSAGSSIMFNVTPVYGGCSAGAGNSTAVLLDRDGKILAATKSVAFSSTIMQSAVTVQQLIDRALSSVVVIPEGVFAGKCNCNSVINSTTPARMPGTVVEIKGSEGRSVIDCSGTRMRCLIVQQSSVNVVNIIFKGGSSPAFVSTGMIAALQTLFDAENPTFGEQSNQTSKMSASGIRYSGLDMAIHKSFSDKKNLRRHKHRSKLGQGSKDGSNARYLKKWTVVKNDVGMKLITKVHDNITNSRISSSKKLRWKRNRQLLQSAATISMFNVNADGAGGCILVLAPAHSISLSGVSMMKCSAVYGGGGFFDVSLFAANQGIVQGNVARQGAGIFVAASQRSDIQRFNFMKNTVVASIGSNDRLTFQSRSNFRSFSLIPNPNAAAGGGLWVQRLSSIRDCNFSHNMALASGGSVSASAIGGSMFVLQTSRNSEISDLYFSRSKVLCSGSNCTAAGNFFIASTDFNTSLHRLVFVECHLVAAGAITTTIHSEAWGSALVVHEASAGMLRINNVQSSHCSAKSSGFLSGGVMYFPRLVFNAVISNISITNFSVNSDIRNEHLGSLLAFYSIESTTISHVTVTSAQLIYPHMRNRVSGAVLHCSSLKNSSLSSWNIIALLFRVDSCKGSSCLLFGGLAQVGTMDDNSFMDDISMQSCSFRLNATGDTIGAGLLGVFLYFQIVFGVNPTSSSLHLRRLTVRNFSASVLGESSSIMFLNNVQSLSVFVNMDPILEGFSIENCTFENISHFCSGSNCRIFGLLYMNMVTGLSSMNRAQKNESPMLMSDLIFKNIVLECSGVRCQVRGGCVLLYSIYSGVLRNVYSTNISLLANGTTSFAGGTVLYHLFNDPTGFFLIQNVSSENSLVHTSGGTSSAIGGAMVAMYGVFTVLDSTFRKSYVACAGTKCQAAGGVFAFTSAYGYSPDRFEPYSAFLSNVDISDAIVNCLGEFCSAAGGAGFIGVAYRGPVQESSRTDGITTIAPKHIVELSLKVRFNNCRVFRCMVMSESVGAALTGAGLSILLATVEIVNSSIIENTIQSALLSGFIAGSGIYVTGPNSSVFIVSTELKQNSAGSTGLGGALFAGPESSLICHEVVLEFNSASRGGGLMSDLASVSLSACTISNNSATDKGGGIFGVNSMSLKGVSSLFLKNVTVVDNFLRNDGASAVGAAVFLLGDVLLQLHNRTRIVMTGDSKFTTSEAVLSLMRPVSMSNNTVFSCKGGSVLVTTPTQVTNQIITLNSPSAEDEFGTQCSPACFFRPEGDPFDASGGLLASCVPCPRGTYSIAMSSNSNDTVASMCLPCPFGALCNGGSNVSAAKAHWGWKISERQLAPRFILLPPGYACENNCSAVAPCGGNRAGILCGACAANHSVAFFQTECVPSAQCSESKWAPLILMCFVYQFIFSVWIYWSSETALISKEEQSRIAAREALKHVSLFQNMSAWDFDAVVSRMEIVHVSATSTILSQGHSVNCMYIIEKGVLDVFAIDDVTERLVASLGSMSTVGEVALIDGAKCKYSVRARVDSELWRLDRSCLNYVAEEEKISFLQAKQAQHANPSVKYVSAASVDAALEQSSAFAILMWFYQLSGIMLSVSSPLDYLDGSAIAFSIVSFFVNSKPSSEATSDVSTKVAPQTSLQAADSGPYKFCVSESFTMSQLYVTTFMYYVLWALLMVILSHKRVWRFMRSAVIKFTLGSVACLDFMSGMVKGGFKKDTAVFFATLREQFSSRQDTELEIRGPVLLKWAITCFSALSSLMMQGTACFRLNGFLDDTEHLRWIYDGRVACFSDSEDFPGRWQIASAFGVALCVLAPAVLWGAMSAIQQIATHERTPFQQTLWDAYSGHRPSNAYHWMVVMYDKYSCCFSALYVALQFKWLL